MIFLMLPYVPLKIFAMLKVGEQKIHDVERQYQGITDADH